MMKFHHIICWGNFGETDTFPIISQGGNGNFRFPSIFHRNLSISLKFPPKNYGEILMFFAVLCKIVVAIATPQCYLFKLKTKEVSKVVIENKFSSQTRE